jgi:hypothetical protein
MRIKQKYPGIHNGKMRRYTLSTWATKYGISVDILERGVRCGVSVAEMLDLPDSRKRRIINSFLYGKKYEA